MIVHAETNARSCALILYRLYATNEGFWSEISGSAGLPARCTEKPKPIAQTTFRFAITLQIVATSSGARMSMEAISGPETKVRKRVREHVLPVCVGA